MNTLKKIERLLSKCEDALVALLLFGILFSAVAQIILRNFFSTSLAWTDPSLKMAVLWLTLIGSIIAARENRHLSIDVFSKFLPVHIKRKLDIVVQCISALFCLVLAFYAVQFVSLAYEFEDKFLNRFPLWWLQAILPVGFALMGLRFMLNIFTPQTATDYMTGKDDGELLGDVQ